MNVPHEFPMTRRAFAGLLAGWGLASSVLPQAAGQNLDAAVMQMKHPWGKCVPGASKRVRVVTETVDAKGRVTNSSTTDTYSFLEEITDRDYTLRVEVTVEVGGKRFTSQPQSVKQGYFGESPGQAVTFKKVRDEEISLLGRPVTVENREVTIHTDQQRRTAVVHFSDSISPHVLKSVTTVTNGDGKTPIATTQVEVLATGMPYRVLGELREASYVRTVHTQPKRTTTITVEVHCADVPGGVVAHTSKELDETGAVVKRSTLELLEFDVGDRDNVEVSGRRSRAQNPRRTREPVPADRNRRR